MADCAFPRGSRLGDHWFDIFYQFHGVCTLILQLWRCRQVNPTAAGGTHEVKINGDGFKTKQKNAKKQLP